MKPGEVVEYQVELPEPLRKLAGGGKQLSPVAIARCAVAVPLDFDPAKTWPVLVVSSTTVERRSLSVALLRRFAAPATAAGWVVVAADPDQPVTRDDDTNPLRYALAKTALAALELKWPAITQSPLAVGGFSGGAKRSAWLAALAVVDGFHPIGVFQGGCNEPTMANALEAYRPDRGRFRAIPVFLSSGTTDPIATPADHARVRDELLDAGFKHLRLETFAGAHEVYAPHIAEALQWFATLAGADKSRPPAAGPPG